MSYTPPNCTFIAYTRKQSARRGLIRLGNDHPDPLLKKHEGKWGFWVDDQFGTPTTGAFPEDVGEADPPTWEEST